jgi:hypothetical protein
MPRYLIFYGLVLAVTYSMYAARGNAATYHYLIEEPAATFDERFYFDVPHEKAGSNFYRNRCGDEGRKCA